MDEKYLQFLYFYQIFVPSELKCSRILEAYEK